MSGIASEIAAITKHARAVYDSMTPDQQAMVDEARSYATNYAAAFVDRTRELDGLRRQVRGFAATWHRAMGHELSLDDCHWSTCRDLLTGSMSADILAERASELPVPA